MKNFVLEFREENELNFLCRHIFEGCGLDECKFALSELQQSHFICLCNNNLYPSYPGSALLFTKVRQPVEYLV